MKIKDITEGLYDTLAGAKQTFNTMVGKPTGDETSNFNAAMKAVPEPKAPSSPTGTATDIKDTLDPQTQYRFPNPEFPGTQIIVRQNGWYLDKLPPELRGKVNVDKATRLYPILQTKRISLYNQYYNQAAEAGKIKEEPASML